MARRISATCFFAGDDTGVSDPFPPLRATSILRLARRTSGWS
jgi:hypothetical protein